MEGWHVAGTWHPCSSHTFSTGARHASLEVGEDGSMSDPQVRPWEEVQHFLGSLRALTPQARASRLAHVTSFSSESICLALMGLVCHSKCPQWVLHSRNSPREQRPAWSFLWPQEWQLKAQLFCSPGGQSGGLTG